LTTKDEYQVGSSTDSHSDDNIIDTIKYTPRTSAIHASKYDVVQEVEELMSLMNLNTSSVMGQRKV